MAFNKGSFLITCAAMLAVAAGGAQAQGKAEVGVTSTEVKLGQTMPYSGPNSAYGIEGRVQTAYFKMINDKGGINGRKVNLISLDDSYSPPKTVEQTRKLVEVENVMGIVGTLGTAGNMAIRPYLNSKKVPQVLVLTGAMLGDGTTAPWTTTFLPPYAADGKIFAAHILKNFPNARIGTISQNDDLGREFIRGLKEGLGSKAASLIVKEATYDTTDTSTDSQILSLQASGADTLMIAGVAKFPAQSLRKTYDIGWKPQVMIFGAGNSIKTSLEPAGLERSIGVLTSVWLKTPGDASWVNDKGMQEYLSFMKKYMPGETAEDQLPAIGYTTAQIIAHVIAQCGNDLSRENFAKQATAISNPPMDLLLPGVSLNSSPTVRNPVSQMQMARFDGKAWIPLGPVLTADSTK
ncbi:ABC transporter substrate-binding protein [soil metagenome]